MSLILPFSKIHEPEKRLVGNKAYHLAQLQQRGIPIPKGFVISAEAFSRFLHSESTRQIARTLSEFKPSSQRFLTEISQQLQTAVARAEFDFELKHELLSAYEKLNASLLHSPSVLLKPSSNTQLSIPVTTHPITGDAQFFEQIKYIWAQCLNKRNLHSFVSRQFPCAIIVQEFVVPEVSGYIHTTDPESKKHYSIHAIWDLPQSITQHNEGADYYRVDPAQLSVVSTEKRLQHKSLILYHGSYTPPCSFLFTTNKKEAT